ncbi:tripartite tricarboxylate transporter substrate binding protein [Aliamphritea spongicola]|uniref:tripartite tricarboxylate transporter substrate binding protein n=1 Tax=Aliamphritea spongicola TaxID=707589 RepID=UPI00196B7767|nr:tripartite tricarboxylate transporter substrate binding protein [Aliamphritea spongicola]MBN3560822.1 tripartite tricarboxylate transporter substrate binding protein [Aliamphritea spongicola]
MKFRSRIASLVAGTALALSATATTAVAADFPDRPINLIVGYKAGGGVDTYARALAKVAPQYLNDQPVVVVNKPGGGGLIGGRFVADQPPTGYSLYLSSAGSMVLRNLAKRQVVSSQDFKQVATIGELTAGVFVPASSEIKTLDELIAKLQSSDTKLRWGHTGRGNVWHVAGVGLLDKNGLKAKDVPFKGGSGVRSAVISGQVDFAVIGAHLGRGFEKDIRQLAVLSDSRHPAVPEIPTAAELNVEYTKVSSPIVVMAPKRVSDATVGKLSEAITAIAKDARFAEVLSNAGLPTVSLDASESQDLIDNARANWKPLLGAK